MHWQAGPIGIQDPKLSSAPGSFPTSNLGLGDLLKDFGSFGAVI